MKGMPAKIHIIKLSLQEREELQAISRSQKTAAAKVVKAKALLLCDQGDHGSALKDEDVASRCDCTVQSLERWRKRCSEVGPLQAVERKVRLTPPRIKKFGGYEQAQLVKLACSDAPKGHARWTLCLLAERIVEMNIVKSVSRETIRRELKKTNLNRG